MKARTPLVKNGPVVNELAAIRKRYVAGQRELKRRLAAELVAIAPFGSKLKELKALTS
jgi:hypothetical protein